MSNLQLTIIGILSMAAALSILCFDKRGHQHKPLVAFIAYLTFLQMSALLICACAQAHQLLDWLLIFGLAIQVGTIILAGGNINKVYHPKLNQRDQAHEKP